ncbi:conjugal transfer protein TraN [Chlamydiales bacterium]|nr:conjugal transfer protein TraN [Chlamydiales bacterium]
MSIHKRKALIIFISFFGSLYAEITSSNPQMKSIQENAKSISGPLVESLKKSLHELDPIEIIPHFQQRKMKDEEVSSSKEKILNNEPVRTEFVSHLINVHMNAESASLDSEERLFSDQEQEADNDYFYETSCEESGEPALIQVTRDLFVQIDGVPQTEKIKTCKGHKKKTSHSLEKNAHKEQKAEINRISSDSTIHSYTVEVSGGTLFTDYHVTSKWTHKKNTASCSHYTTKTIISDNTMLQESGDTWKYSNPIAESLLKDSSTKTIQINCLDDTPMKVVNGKEVRRPCWKESLTLSSHNGSKQGCLHINKSSCELIEKICLEEGPFGCTLWKKKFRCFKALSKRNGEIDFKQYLGDDIIDKKTKPNSVMSNALSKLSVYKEIKRDLEESDAVDSRQVEIFKGKEYFCTKNILDNLMYDCCNGHSGLALEMKLAKCNDDEITLTKLREMGKCTYIGPREGKFLALWKSRSEKVFCCFDSKLSRVFQEQAREQLQISWGNGDNPDCKGLLINEIEQLNFDKINLEEAFASPDKESIHRSLDNYRNRLQNQIINEGGDGV